MATREDRIQPVPGWPLTFLSQDPVSMSGAGVMGSICCDVDYGDSQGSLAWEAGASQKPAVKGRGFLMLTWFFCAFFFLSERYIIPGMCKNINDLFILPSIVSPLLRRNLPGS